MLISQKLAARISLLTLHQALYPPSALPTLGLVHQIQPYCSHRVLGAKGDEIQTWEQQFHETNREANSRRHALWARAGIFPAETCLETRCLQKHQQQAVQAGTAAFPSQAGRPGPWLCSACSLVVIVVSYLRRSPQIGREEVQDEGCSSTSATHRF